GARDPGKAGEPPARINVWGRAPWNETWGDSFDPEWTAGERGRHRATHAEPARPTRRAPEVFPYAHKDAAFSFTAVPEHRQPTECSWAANPTTVELDGPPSWAAFSRGWVTTPELGRPPPPPTPTSGRTEGSRQAEGQVPTTGGSGQRSAWWTPTFEVWIWTYPLFRSRPVPGPTALRRSRTSSRGRTGRRCRRPQRYSYSRPSRGWCCWCGHSPSPGGMCRPYSRCRHRSSSPARRHSPRCCRCRSSCRRCRRCRAPCWRCGRSPCSDCKYRPCRRCHRRSWARGRRRTLRRRTDREGAGVPVVARGGVVRVDTPRGGVAAVVGAGVAVVAVSRRAGLTRPATAHFPRRTGIAVGAW